jgi:peptide-methionine (R)-S-oxide reductase
MVACWNCFGLAFTFLKMTKSILTICMALSIGLAACQSEPQPMRNAPGKTINTMNMNQYKTDEEWKKILSPEQYRILREKGTERPHSSELNNHFEKGTYVCAGCGTELFTSEQKFDGHCGWPSFDNEIGPGDRVKKIKDYSHGMVRTEIVCAKCGGHLGHIFDDGPTQTGQRYCVNGVSIGFKRLE